MRLSIVIVNWNTHELLKACLATIFHDSTLDDFEVWVVDNASEDNSLEMVEEAYPMVDLIHNDSNIGFAEANNQAIRQCTGKYIVLLNPDTEVIPGSIEVMLCYLDAHPEVGACGPQLIHPNGSLQVSCYPDLTLFREFWRLFHLENIWHVALYPIKHWDLDASHEVDVIQGACLALRRDALDQEYLFDEDYFIYTEEVDLCNRLRRAGWGIRWVPQAKVVHYGGQSTNQVAEGMFLQLYRSKLLYFRKHSGILGPLIYKAILFGASIFRLILLPISLLIIPQRRSAKITLANRYISLMKELPKM